MGAEAPLNPDRAQQKFEGLVEHAEGAVFLDQSDVDERYKAALDALVARIDTNPYLEEGEKRSLKQAALKQVMASLERTDAQLDGVLRAQASDREARCQVLYSDATKMVNELCRSVGKQIDSASDAWHIDDTEFASEVLGQVTYMYSGIPVLDALAKSKAATGLSPKDAMRAAAEQYIHSGITVFDYDTLVRRYPKLGISEVKFSCLRVNEPENLRAIDTGKVVRAAKPGEIFQVIAPFEQKGAYTYELVMDKRHNVYKMCTNDGNHVARLSYENYAFQNPETAAEGVDTNNIAEPLRTMVLSGYAYPDGRLSSSVNSLRIDQVLPPDTNQATVILRNNFNGTGIPTGTPLAIVRSGGTFVFAEPYQAMGRPDGRVRIYAGDEIVPTTPGEKPASRPSDTGADTSDTGTDPEDTSEFLERNNHEIPYSVAAYWRWMRSSWQAPNVIEREMQEKAVCSAYVQRTLEGLYGHDFAKEVFIENGHFVDAWELPRRIEESGYGHIAMDFSRYYSVDRAKPKVSIDYNQAGYNNDVVRLLGLASRTESKTGVLFMHFKHTKADPMIVSCLDEGGSLNSHAMLILGPGTRSFEATSTKASLADAIIGFIQAKLGPSYDNSWEENRFLLGQLRGITVNGAKVAAYDGHEFLDTDGNVIEVNKGDSISYVDTQVTDFYHSEVGGSPARTVGLTETMIQGNFDPVKLAQWDGDVIDNRTPDVGKGFIVGEFRVESGMTDLPTAIRDHYLKTAQDNPAFAAANPDVDKYVKRTMDFLLYVHVINSPSSLPVIGARIPIFDWSKKPERTASSKETRVGYMAQLEDAARNLL